MALQKLQLFREFYIMVVLYICFTRIVVYACAAQHAALIAARSAAHSTQRRATACSAAPQHAVQRRSTQRSAIASSLAAGARRAAQHQAQHTHARKRSMQILDGRNVAVPLFVGERAHLRVRHAAVLLGSP